MNKLTVKQLDLKNKRVLLRVDFNTPLDKTGAITDDTRIVEALPTIRYILDHGGTLILMSHLGRPNGKKDLKYTLRSIAVRLSELLQRPVQFAEDCIGSSTLEQARNLTKGEILLLENLRFYAAEEEPESDPSFAKQLASLGDVYVNDAFGTAHRAHSSTATIAQYFPGKAGCGFLIEKELKYFIPLITEPKRPFFALLGGAKISSKLGILKVLSTKVDALFIGGGMIFTLLKAQGIEIGDSLVEEGQLREAKTFLNSCKVPVHLPVDLVIANEFSENAKTKIILTSEGIPPGWRGMDIGPQTLQEWKKELLKGKTIFWNGPMGVFEFPSFARGTEGIAKLLASHDATVIIGGGDSAAAINQLKLNTSFTHISTGGGAALELLELGHLPGIDALSDN